MPSLEEFLGVTTKTADSNANQAKPMSLEDYVNSSGITRIEIEAPTPEMVSEAKSKYEGMKTDYGDILTEAAQKTAASVASTPQFVETLINPNKSVLTDPIIPQSYRNFFGLDDTAPATDIVGRTLEKIPANVAANAAIGAGFGGVGGALAGAVVAIPQSIAEASAGEIGAKITGEDTRPYWEIAGGVGSAFVTGGIEASVKGAVNKAKQARSASGSNIDALLTRDRTLQSIVESSGSVSFSEQIANFQKAVKDIDPSLEITPALLMRDNPSLEKAMKTLAAQDPALIQMQREAFRELVEKTKQAIFSNANIPDKNAALLALENMASEASNKAEIRALYTSKELGKNAEMANEAINARLISVYDELRNAAPSDVMGEQARSAYNTAVKAKIEHARGLYTPVLKEAVDNGVDIAPNQTASVYNTFKEMSGEEFKGLPEPLRIALNKFRPSVSEIPDPAGGFIREMRVINGKQVPYPIPKTIRNEEFGSVNLADLHKLRQEINYLSNNNYSPATTRMLIEAKKKVDEQIDVLAQDERFAGTVAKYKTVNKNYADVVGRGIKDLKTTETMDSNVWDAVALNITTNPQNAKEFLSHTGGEGKVILERAVKTVLAKKALDDATGSVDFTRLRTQVRNMQEVLRLPELSDLNRQLNDDTIGFILKTKDEVKQLEAAQIEAAKAQVNDIFQRVMKVGVDGYVDAFKRSPEARNAFFKTLSEVPEHESAQIIQAMRARLIDDAIQKGSKFPDFAEATPVANAYAKLFSKSELKALEGWTTTLQKMKDNEVIFERLDPTFRTVVADPWLEKYGISRPSFVTTMKSKVMDIWSKLIFVGSTVEQNKAVQKAMAANKEVLTDINKLHEVALELESKGVSSITPMDVSKVQAIVAKYSKDEIRKGGVSALSNTGKRVGAVPFGVTTPEAEEERQKYMDYKQQQTRQNMKSVREGGLFE